MKVLQKALQDGSFILDLEARDLRSIVHQTLNFVIARGQLPQERREEVKQALLAREEEASTAIGHAVAVPHVYHEAFTEPVVVFVRLDHPLNLGAPDGTATRFLFVLLGPPGGAARHLDTLMHIARLMSDDAFRYEVGTAVTQQDLLDAFEHFLIRTAPPAAPEKPEVSPGLQYTGTPGGGLINDIRRRLPHYWSDFRDGLHQKSIASTLFLLFACLAPAVTFGGVMAVETGGHIGPVEMLLASAFCGVVFALFSGQPLIILGGTGPLLIFTAMLYQLCLDLEIPFLPAYAWVGLWTAGFLVLLAVTDASALMRYFTRFTDESFAALISLIFIYEAIKALVDIFVEADRAGAVDHDKPLLSLLLAVGTFYVAMNLSRFRSSRYLHPRIREFLADFGPTIAIGLMTLIAVWLHEVSLDYLPAPDTLRPTYPPDSEASRAWLINPFTSELPQWVWFAAAGPAALGTVLLYLDQNITARIINSPKHKLKKGEAYHLDVGLVGLLVGFCSLFGLPWLVAATVRSLNHLHSLATHEEVVSRDGGSREQIIHVRENRVTPLAIHLLIGVSLLLLPALKAIPMAVLYGLFLFMGVVSMKGNQFFERLSLWLMDSSLYPVTHYIRKVPMWTIHKFTILQAGCLAVLWAVKTSRLGILFPLFIALLVPVRQLAARFFDPKHLEVLDAEEDPDLEEDRWVP